MSEGRVIYVAVCEILLVVVVVVFLPAFLFSKMFLATSGILALSIGIGKVAVAFMQRRKWAWYASWGVGVFAVAFGCWIFWAAAHASHEGDGGEAVLIAIPILVLAVPAWWMMVRSNLEEFVSIGR